MKIKVCGMREAGNVQAVARLGIDMMGFIFAPKSPRYTDQVPARTDADSDVLRTGVFVNADEADILRRVSDFDLDYLQLHGTESRETCLLLREKLAESGRAIKLIKAISVKDTDDVKRYGEYVGAVDWLLFDTKCPMMGGSGKQFDWSVLEAYDGDVPFLLSGGIGPDDAERIRNFHHPKCIGIDLNSKFEIEPGLKDVEKLKEFLLKVKR